MKTRIKEVNDKSSEIYHISQYKGIAYFPTFHPLLKLIVITLNMIELTF